MIDLLIFLSKITEVGTKFWTLIGDAEINFTKFNVNEKISKERRQRHSKKGKKGNKEGKMLAKPVFFFPKNLAFIKKLATLA